MARMGRPPTPAIERFSRRIRAVPSGCIEWTGTVDRYGYGQFRPGGRDSANMGAHRWAYETHVGPIPTGLHIDHLCRNRRCVNPDHLEPVTPRENVMRGISPTSINARKTHCVAGHPLSGDNIYPDSKQRVCKVCKKATSDRNYRRRQAS